MQLSRKALDNYTDSLNSVIQNGQDVLRAQLRSIDYSRPVEEWRDTVVGVMEACCGGTSEMSAGIAAAFYDGVRERAVGEMMGAYHQSGRSSEATRKATQYFIGTLLDGDYDAFEELCMQRLDYETKRAAGQCISYNAQNDATGLGDVRYARVPTGEETCEFCIMLASRGPVYLTFDSAGGDDHFHPHCDCRIVPFFGTYVIGDSRRGSIMTIEGYDPDAYFEQYLGFATKRYRARMAEAADRAHARHGGGWGSGVSQSDMAALINHIRGATTYEDLIERVNTVDSGSDYMTEKQWNQLLEQARRKRKELLSDQS